MRNKAAVVSNPADFVSCAGDRMHKLFDTRFDGQRVVLEESGSFDIQERINGFAPYTDIAYMLNRLKVGDDSVLSGSVPMYGDFSGMFDNPADAINLYHGAEAAFNKIPASERLKYNNDFRVWLADVMAGNLADIVNPSGSEPVVEVQPVDPKPDVKE